jgi:hypothetical protein
MGGGVDLSASDSGALGQPRADLRAWCSAKQLADGGLKHFEWLLGKKNLFSHDDRAVRIEDCLVAKVRVEQFFAWAFQTFPDVAQIVGIDHA